MITKEEFERYERVRERGRFNMLSAEARTLTGLSEEKYREIINNYSDLADKFIGPSTTVSLGDILDKMKTIRKAKDEAAD
jgi:hypothetical protein